ncbi:MAG: SIS domain-containing protein [Actinobacteria bacterium]|nr:MAG: SIS domain-containing protein [Actinomycetota bacterium]
MDIARVLAQLEESAVLHERLKDLAPQIVDVATLCVEALRGGKKLIFLGNGGSAADAQHLACEMVVKFAFERPALPAVALTANSSVLTAASNDLGFEQVFSRQIEALAVEGDVVFAISTSGTSPNVLAAARAARERGCRLVALTGERGEELAVHCDVAISVPHGRPARIQEAHITIGHVVCDLVEASLYGERGV